MKLCSNLVLLLVAYFHPVCASYQLYRNYSGSSFFDGWDFFAGADPTHGFVRFQTREDAITQGLVALVPGDGSSTKQAYIGVDSRNTTPNGRPAIRLESKQSFYHSLIVADIAHMPGGICGTWPALWTFGADVSWPQGGEIDIIEGANEQNRNAMTLHTTEGVVINNAGLPELPSFTGHLETKNCDVNAEGQPSNAGCSISDKSPLSYGTAFNAAGGGVFVTEWTSQAIKMWFFPRGKVPRDVLAGNPSPGKAWGKPSSMFSGDFEVDRYFQAQKLIIDTTFCGDWAGSVWPYSTCASKAPTCNDFVQNNPGAFENAYWLINSIKLFQNDENIASASSTKNGNGTKTIITTLTVTLTKSSASSSSAPITSRTNRARSSSSSTSRHRRTRTKALPASIITGIDKFRIQNIPQLLVQPSRALRRRARVTNQAAGKALS